MSTAYLYLIVQCACFVSIDTNCYILFTTNNIHYKLLYIYDFLKGECVVYSLVPCVTHCSLEENILWSV